MERKDLTPSEEMLFNVYNNNHKTKFEDLKEYFANYEKVKGQGEVYQCQDDIERDKKLIAGRYETPKQLEGLNIISFKRRTNN